MCWSNSKFDQTPPSSVCALLCDCVSAARLPSPPPSAPSLRAPGEHFSFTTSSQCPDALQRLLRSGRCAAGWIDEVRCFWAADAAQLFVFSPDFAVCAAAALDAPAICAGFCCGHIVVAQHGRAAAFAFPSLAPRCSCACADTVTCIRGGVAGCASGALRWLRVRGAALEFSGFASLRDGDAVCAIAATPNYYAAQALSGRIAFFRRCDLRAVGAADAGAVAALWAADGDAVLALDRRGVAREVGCRSGAVSVGGAHALLPGGAELRSALWAHGFLTAVSSAPSFDLVLLLRPAPAPVYTTNTLLGTVAAVGATPFEVALLTSTGVHTVYEAPQCGEREEVWRFANAVLPYWESAVGALPAALVESLSRYGALDTLSRLARYVITIAEDAAVLPRGAGYEQRVLREFFGEEREELFSGIRNASFRERTARGVEIFEEPTQLDVLIRQAGLGAEGAAEQALSLIMNSFPSLPEKFQMYCEFLFANGFFEELIECVEKWSSSVLPDSVPLGNDLREDVYACLIPFLELAISRNCREDKAVSALQKELNGKNRLFQLFVLNYFEKCGSINTFLFFKYPEMINQMKEINSKYLFDLYNALGFLDDGYEYLYQSSISESDISIDDRIALLNKAKELNSNNEVIEKYEKCAYLLKDFIERNYPKIQLNFFSYDFDEIVDTLANYNQNELILDLMSIYEQNDYEMLKKFLCAMDIDSLKLYIRNSAVFIQKEVIEILYETYGIEVIKYLLESDVNPQYIFDILVHIEKSKLVENSSIIPYILNKIEYIEEEKKQKIVDTLCELIVEFDIKCEYDTSNAIRAKIGKCFIEQKFKDQWDD